MTIMMEAPTVPAVDDAWNLYLEVFTDIDELAAQRHLLTYPEFEQVYHDPDVLKIYTHGDDGTLAGMAVLTRELDAWPLISPRFFARRWPAHYQRRAIWYVGWVGVRPRQPRGFRDLITRIYEYIDSNDGIGVMDCCTHNITQRHLPQSTLKLLSRLNPGAAMETADAQTFVAYTFDHTSTGA